ncbi:MAG: 4-hydroxythreonine-4-phosphate dehydrogenase PdxA [Bacteroidia bacterium]|jgi:4-hydroxythreonine-4-phosphate dehydrogenase|nr:4-hydroxythreonine-4-phosphate dehydrogenase PdxA [Bacteroidia bacterium]
MDRKPIVGITLGDYNGIGPEVIIKTLEDERLYRFCTVVVYGQKNVISYYTKLLKIQNFNIQETQDTSNLNPKIPNIINVWKEQANVQPGIAHSDAGARALECLNAGIKDLTENNIDVLVTGPVNKSTVSEHLPEFTGQTELVSKASGAQTSMMLLADDGLRVGLVTNHVSLKDVTSKIDSALILQKIEVLNATLKKDFLVHKPRIAVMGLNPHAGDNSLLGKEEKEIIAPAVNRAKEKGIIALGPFSADGFFGSQHYRKFDAVLAMYHDQGLVPFKTISFGSGVNYTAGLNVIRTSPDHGTGYDIAGKDVAGTESLRNAIFMGLDVLKNRSEYALMTANPVERVVVERE